MELSDGDLLRRFVQDGDEDAFAAIVRRYHGLVMSVCRRVTYRCADAEDAFQATFLALARRPRAIARTASLSSWLYVVAWRTSLGLVKQRRNQPMDCLSEEPVNTTPGPLDQITSAQNLRVLDEELNRLPAKYRDVLVMAYFANRSNQQIADELNVTRGTVDGRLRRGRNQLRIRLARRGVSLGVLAVVTGLAGQAAAATSPELLSSTTELGIQTLTCSVPSTTDLTTLETLIRPETAFMNSNLLLTTVACVSIVAGALGLSVGVEEDAVAGHGPELQEHAFVDVRTEVDSARVFLVSQSAALPDDSAAPAGGEEPEDDGDFVGGGMRAIFHSWPEDAQPVERWMHEIMEEPVPALEFRGETPLSDVLDYLVMHFSEAHGSQAGESFELTIWADSRVLEQESIDSLDDVVVDDIMIEGMTLRNALKAIFGRTADPALTWVIRDELMIVTTVDEAEGDHGLSTRIYPVGPLLAVNTPPWNPPVVHRGSGAGVFALADNDDVSDSPQTPAEVPQSLPALSAADQTKVDNMKQLMAVIERMTSPPLLWVASDGEGGSMHYFGECLVVRQTYSGHQEIVRLLNQLTESLP